MRILVETHTAGDAATLDQAWSHHETFAFVPRKSAARESWLRAAGERLPSDLRSGHFALLTSGTTGHPKLVVGSRVRAEKLAAVLHTVQLSEPVDETVVALPLTYSYAFVNQWLWSRVHGRRLRLTNGLSDPGALRETLHASRNGMLCLVGPQLALVAASLAHDQFPGIIRVHFAGGRFPQERLSDVYRLFPAARVFNNYGCAEAMPRLTIRAASDGHTSAAVGRPLPGIELQTDRDGTLRFRSPFGAVAVIEENRVHRYAPDEWIRTEDVAEYREGQWFITGRRGDIFKRYGEKVAASEIVNVALETWNGSAATYRLVDDRGEEGVVLVFAPHPAPSDLRNVLQRMRSLPRAHWPLRIESVPEMPALPNGKPDVRGLADSPLRITQWRQRI